MDSELCKLTFVGEFDFHRLPNTSGLVQKIRITSCRRLIGTYSWTWLKSRRSSLQSGWRKKMTNIHSYFACHVYYLIFNLMKLAFSVSFQPTFNKCIRRENSFISIETLKRGRLSVKTNLFCRSLKPKLIFKITQIFPFSYFWSNDFLQLINKRAPRIPHR